MEGTGLARRLDAAAARVDRVMDELKAATPEAVDGCAGLLQLACEDLAGGLCRLDRPGGDAVALAAAMQLRSKIQQAGCLLDTFYRFHARWGQLLGARTGGYLPGGQAAPVPAASRLYMRG